MFFLLWSFVFLLIFCFWNFVWKRRFLPPGPTPIPLLVNTLTLARFAPGYEAYKMWAKKYGPIYTIWLGEDPIVVVADFEIMREAFVKNGDAYSGRHLMTAINQVLTATNGNYGVIRTEGDRWKLMRRFALQAMRDLGMGRKSLEQKILEDFEKIFDPLLLQLENGGRSIHRLDPFIDRLAGSTINQLLFGKGLDGESLSAFSKLKATLEEQRLTIVTIRGRLLMGMPFLRHLPFFSSTFAKFDGQVSDTYAFFEKNILERIERRKEAADFDILEVEENKDLLNCFLDQMDRMKAEGEEQTEFNLQNLRSLCYDLFLAGQETICITLNFLVLYLLLDQRAQAKMQKELDEFDETEQRNGQPIRMADRNKLPYVNAVINETQRLCNLLPLNLTHRTTCDVELLDGKIRLPKGTNIVPQISCALYDERVFPEPDKFIPERFIEASGELKRIDEFVPFSLGKRQCLGESLARMELFLFTANFFRKFKVFAVDPLNPPTAKKQLGFGVFPYPFSCRLELRNR